MTPTPAVGVGAGRATGNNASSAPGWLSTIRSVLVLSVLLASVAVLLAPARPGAAGTGGSLDLRATYDVQATINWKQSSIFVSTVARVHNTRDQGVSQLVFNAIPTRLGRMNLIGASMDGLEAQPRISGQSIVVELPNAIPPGEEGRVRIDYRAFFNTDTSGKRALFMKKNGIAAAYRWIPWLSREQVFKTPNFGESWVTGVSQRVDVTFHSDVPLTFATSGWKTGGDGTSQSFAATDVRDFNFSASPNYEVTNIAWRGVDVQILTRSYEPARLWRWARQALTRFSDKVGAYPYRQFTIAETPAGVGMESPGMIWVDSSIPSSHLSFVVVHETAHHWFYAVVGNNQAAAPFVDESVTEFLTRELLSYSRESKCGLQPLDRTVYEYSSGCYAPVIYGQGSQYMRFYRNAVGEAIFWDALSALYRERGFQIVGIREFWNFLDARTGFDSSRHAQRFPSHF